MPIDPDVPYDAVIESFELYHIYHSPSRDGLELQYDTGGADWNAAVLKGPALPSLGQATAGAVGAAVPTIVMYPLSLIVTRLQLQRQLRAERERSRGGKERERWKGGEIVDEADRTGDGGDEQYAGILDGANKIYKNEGGWSGLYTGVTEATGKAVVESFVFFLSYSFLRRRRLRARGLKAHALLPVLDELAVGYLAEGFMKLITAPISTVLTQKQVEGLSKKKQHPSTTRDIVSTIIAKKGIKGLWSGCSASLFLSLNPSITFLLSEVLKFSLLPREKRKHPPAAAIFIFAVLSKAFASSLTYPFSMAKTRAQAAATSTPASTAPAQPPSPQPTVLHTIYSIARTEGPTALYAGLTGDVLRRFFSHGIAMLAKDSVYALIVRCYYMLLVLLRRYPSPEELLARAKERAGELAESTGETVGELARSVKERAGEGVAEVKRKVVEDVYSSEVAEMVGEYVEDEAEEWRTLYRWFWDKGKSS
ncbi:hypothetical protein ACO22_07392 [Paracoccidioides brasiliensis]|uniref:Uncharacterized protein n=1 Tax=Paracoccidioides brasiliensis TaxID=121759 RepID=A0A1D2J4U0_PARBR|nr:hypothetical protein ACO22_07392 [Paracoccidioides brasiliensis]ODH51745.1 hypothetical protein GX48_01987 [Paracoccidioides brasiliensis]